MAQRVSSINSISALCEKTGADITEVAIAVGMDKRIGKDFLKSGPGFGGSCFKKDILNLIYVVSYGLNEVANVGPSVKDQRQQNRITNIIIKLLNYFQVKIGILNITLNHTNDTRESYVNICTNLLVDGANYHQSKVKAKVIIDNMGFF